MFKPINYKSMFDKIKSDNGEIKAYEFILDDLLNKKLIGDNKIKDLFITNFEQQLLSLSPYPFPGQIYTFVDTLSDENQLDMIENRSFHDLSPVVLVLTISNNSFSGFNLNLLSPLQRFSLLQFIWDTFDYGKYEEYSYYNLPFIVKKFINFAQAGPISSCIGVLENNISIPLQQSYRQYMYNNVQNIRYLEPYLWGFVPLLKTNDAKGSSLASFWLKTIR